MEAFNFDLKYLTFCFFIFLFILFFVCRYVFDAEAHSSHLILTHTDHFDFITQRQNILYPVDTLFCDLGDMNHTLFSRSKFDKCTEFFDAYYFTGENLAFFVICYDGLGVDY